MSNYRFFLPLFLLLIAFSASAQSESQMNQLMKERGAQMVAQMNDNISFMADKDKPIDTRRYYKKQALKLFNGEGGPFEENGVMNTGVKMETTSKYRKKPVSKLMRDYFDGLINLRYSKVDIQSTKVNEIKVSDLQKIGDNQYVCTAYFEQVFVGYRDGRPVYKDRTKKKVKIYITAEETLDGTEFIVKLGDVKALEST